MVLKAIALIFTTTRPSVCKMILKFEYVTLSSLQVGAVPTQKKGNDTMTRQLVFETTYNGNAGTVSARPMIRHYDPEKGHYWGYKPQRVAWDYSRDNDANHRHAVMLSCRVTMQKDPVSIEWGGETIKGKLWIVTVTL